MPFGLSAFAVKAIGIGLLVLAILGVIAGFAAHERGAQKAEDAADHQRDVDAQNAKNAAETTRRKIAQQENLHEANRFSAQRAVDAAGLDAVVQRVHDAALGGRFAAAHTAASGASQADGVSVAGMVPADVYARALDAFAETAADAAALAKSVDCLRSSGELCASDYEALNGPNP